MSYFKSFIAFILFSAISNFAYSQTDTSEVDDDKEPTTQMVQINKIMPHKRGVYKTYEEYVSDSPSVEAEFTFTPLQISKNNPLIAEGNVDYKGKRPKKIWGVSDGQYVYIKVMSGQFLKNHYFRLQCDGPRPYISFRATSPTGDVANISFPLNLLSHKAIIFFGNAEYKICEIKY